MGQNSIVSHGKPFFSYASIKAPANLLVWEYQTNLSVSMSNIAPSFEVWPSNLAA